MANELLLDVFENIFINSVRYNKNEIVEIEIAISKMIENDKKFVKLEFKDNGIGIDDNRKKAKILSSTILSYSYNDKGDYKPDDHIVDKVERLDLKSCLGMNYSFQPSIR